MKKSMLFVALATLIGCGADPETAIAQSRDYISIVGSSTVYPFSTVVAERFGRGGKFKTPKVESTGSGGGLKLFCQGVGVSHPDITNSSRRIKESEVALCAENGVSDIVEVLIGYDGIVVANAKGQPRMALTRKDLFLALAKTVPNAVGKLIPNPYQTWKDVNPSLPNQKIEVLGPPPTSGTRDAFVELVMDVGCEQVEGIDLEGGAHQQVCQTLREDGAYIDAGENDNLIVQKLTANPDALGVFGFSFLEQNSDKVQGSIIDGEKPTFDTIADGSYPVSRPLYFYVKKAHVDMIPGIREYLEEFTNERAWGEEGYLAEKGMIPLADDARQKTANDVRSLKNLQL